MSRIGKLPIEIPGNVKVALTGNSVSVTGPKGHNIKNFDDSISIKIEDNAIIVRPSDETKYSQAMHGTVRSIIAGMVKGVVEHFSKNLEIKGVGFKATLKGKILDLSLGKSHEILYSVPEGIQITITDNTKLKVEGIDKKLVGQVAADIKNYYPVEPYKGKGVTVVGQFVLRKQGKKTG